MSSSFNQITIVGYLGRDPESRFTPQGTQVSSFSIATTERRRDSTGEYQDHTTWFQVTCFGRTAELAQEFLFKGSRVLLTGPLKLEEWTDREGMKRSTLKVTADKLHFLGRADGSGGGEGGGRARTPANRGSQFSEDDEDGYGPGGISDSDIPF